MGAPVRRDRWHPCFPRCARLRSPSSVCDPAGTARAPFVGREITQSVVIYPATFVSQSPVRGGVLDAPRSRDRRGRLAADVERDRWHPCFPRHARLRSPSSVCNPAGTARAPFCETWRSELSLPVDRRRGVGDAAPYGRLRNVGISIAVNSCAKATASAHASAPLKGELSRRDAP